MRKYLVRTSFFKNTHFSSLLFIFIRNVATTEVYWHLSQKRKIRIKDNSDKWPCAWIFEKKIREKQWVKSEKFEGVTRLLAADLVCSLLLCIRFRSNDVVITRLSTIKRVIHDSAKIISIIFIILSHQMIPLVLLLHRLIGGHRFLCWKSWKTLTSNG